MDAKNFITLDLSELLNFFMGAKLSQELTEIAKTIRQPERFLHVLEHIILALNNFLRFFLQFLHIIKTIINFLNRPSKFVMELAQKYAG